MSNQDQGAPITSLSASLIGPYVILVDDTKFHCSKITTSSEPRGSLMD